MSRVLLIFIIILLNSCDFKYEKEYKTELNIEGILDTNNWEVLKVEDIKFINNKEWVKSSADGILFTAFFDSTKVDIYTIVKVEIKKRYSAHKYIKLLTDYFKNDTNIAIVDYEILEYNRTNSKVIHFYIEYDIYDERTLSYEFLYEHNGFLYTIGLNLKDEENKKYTGMKFDSKQLYDLLIGKATIDNELLIKDNENVGEFKSLKLEDLK